MARRKRRSRGHIEQLPSGHSARSSTPAPTPLTGRDRRLKEIAPTHADAEVALTKPLRQVDQHQHPKTAITVREAIGQWMEVANLEVTTRERYEDLIRIYIEPRIGDLQAGKLDAEPLERFYARLQRYRELCNGRVRNGHACRPLSSSTTRKIHYILRGALERAVRWRYLTVIPPNSSKHQPRARPSPIPHRPLRPPRCSTTPGKTPSGVSCCGSR